MSEPLDPAKSLSSQATSGSNTESGDETGISWENFSQWLCAVCVVTFDLELGQALEVVYTHTLCI